MCVDLFPINLDHWEANAMRARLKAKEYDKEYDVIYDSNGNSKKAQWKFEERS